MNRNDKLRNALKTLLTCRKGVKSAETMLKIDKEILDKAHAEFIRQLRSSGGKPVRYDGVMYTLNPVRGDQPVTFREEEMSFIDLGAPERFFQGRGRTASESKQETAEDG
ncbi:hypothetical protein LCGC14_0428740 [marine sediment metagenome]|uniref:Uncharacterized protein n=1 Tax=marine sediment metagenome TaxID=412755 RepID=A0A0F9VAL1_9ZZZZ